MTVSYTAKVANSKNFGCFLKLLLRWRGSIYKLVWPDLFVFLSLFFSLSLIYRAFLNETQQRMFEKVSAYCEKYGTLIPVSFVLGFYVSIVVGRWWEQYKCIPWIDTLAIWVHTNISGEEDKDRLLRRTLMRYTCLCITQCFTLISPRVKKRFPTLDHFVEGGLLLENEKEIISEITATVALGAQYPTHWIPLVWASSIVTRARAEDKIKNDSAMRAMMDEINRIKDQCALLISYDWISVPLVYTQVVTLAVYVYFFSCIMGRQWLKKTIPAGTGSESEGATAEFGKHDVDGLDLFFPVFTVLQFFFYMGWLKVAESLLNPFGDDDDDFELNWIVDRNLQVSYLIVDEMHSIQHPELLKDQYWDQVVPQELPHTLASENYKEGPPISSTSVLNLTRLDESVPLFPSIRSRLTMGSATGYQPPGTPTSKRASFRGVRQPSIRSSSSQSTMGGRTTTAASSSMSGKIFRIGSAVKRIISRDHQGQATTTDAPAEAGVFGSYISGQGHDAIPELDESALTITSVKQGQPKPTVQDIFGFDSSAPLAKPEPESAEGSDPEFSLQFPTSFGSMTVTLESENNSLSPSHGHLQRSDPLTIDTSDTRV